MQSAPSKKTTLFRRHRAALLLGAFALGAAGYAGQSYLLTPSPAIAQGTSQTQQAQTQQVQTQQAVPIPSFRPIVERVRPAVVSIQVRAKSGPVASSSQDFEGFPDGHPLERFFRRFEERGDSFRGPRSERRDRGGRRFSRGQGSGFFISADGYVVTNNHVVRNAETVTVTLTDGQSFDARIIGTDDKTDLALLKVDADRDFAHVDWATSDIYVGDWVVAVGNPFGLGGTVTAGIVSARGREIGSGPYDDYIQIDAPINRGNSGGPTFDLTGNVVGVNTAIFSPSGGSVGIGFAIPAATAQAIIEDLKDDGRIVRGWLGVQIQPISADIAESLGLDSESGALVTEPQPDSPALRAGIRPGDAIIAVDGKAIESPRDLARVIAAYEPRSEVTVTLWRDNRQVDMSVSLGQLPGSDRRASLEAAPQDDMNEKLGLALVPGAEAGADGGVAIVEVEPGSVAADKGLRRGDVILSIGGETVTRPRDVEDSVEKARSAGRKAVLFQVQTRNGVRFVALPIERA